MEPWWDIGNLISTWQDKSQITDSSSNSDIEKQIFSFDTTNITFKYFSYLQLHKELDNQSDVRKDTTGGPLQCTWPYSSVSSPQSYLIIPCIPLVGWPYNSYVTFQFNNTGCDVSNQNSNASTWSEAVLMTCIPPAATIIARALKQSLIPLVIWNNSGTSWPSRTTNAPSTVNLVFCKLKISVS
jgi:hypothetical protein